MEADVAIVEVLPGVCGFKSRIVANGDEMYNVTLEITGDCEHIRQLAQQVPQVAGFKELRLPISENAIYRAAAQCKTHAACPVPSAILKAIEVALGMALPADVHMSIRKE
jgi:hypothetical protein